MLFVDCNTELELIKRSGDRNKYANLTYLTIKNLIIIAILSTIYPSR